MWNGISHGPAHFHTKKEASAGAVTETSFQGRETHMKHGVYTHRLSYLQRLARFPFHVFTNAWYSTALHSAHPPRTECKRNHSHTASRLASRLRYLHGMTTPVRLLRSMGWSSFMERQVIYLYFTTFIKVGKTCLPYYTYAAEVSALANVCTSSLTGCGSSHSHLVACASVPLLPRDDGRW